MLKQCNCTPLCEEERLKGHTRQLTKGIHVERDGGGGGVVSEGRRPPLIFDLLCSSLFVCFPFFFQTHAWIKLYVHFLIRPSLDSPLFYVFSYIGKLFLKRDFKMKKKKEFLLS